MARIGVFCLPMPSHVNLFLALAEALLARGHRVTFFGISLNAEKILARGCLFQLLEPDSVPHGTLDSMIRQMATLDNFASMRLQGRFDDLRYEGILTKGPAMVEQSHLDAVIVDQAEACSGSVAEATGLPWVSVCNGLCLNSEPHIPPFFTGWNYSERWWPVARNRLAYTGLKIVTGSKKRLINRHRKIWRLPPLAGFDDTFSPFAQISQQVREFDFPRRNLPGCFHYVGPIRSSGATSVAFPWDRLDGRPLIYASLGTVMNRHGRLYRIILDACAEIDAQLVLSLGGAGNADAYRNAPGAPVIVDFAPQRDLLRHAAIAITHAGLNSTLESFSEGVPLAAIPITFEQPAIAARIQWTGAGEVIPSSKLTVNSLRAIVRKVLHEPSYRNAARKVGNALAQAGGANEAASVIEEVIRTGKPVVPRRVNAV